MYDILIIGAGPAGVSAGLYAKRANLNVLMLYHGKSNLEDATQIDNYYGFAEGVSANELYINGIKQAKNLGIDVKEEEVLNIEPGDRYFKIITTSGDYEAKSVIISTGNKKLRPNIPGVKEFEGKGISYCAICDGFFYKGKDVCVIGNGNFAVNEAKELKHIAGKVTIFTNGMDVPENADGFEINKKNIKKIIGDAKVNAIEFDDGQKLKIDGIFIALGEAGGSDFAKKLGLFMDGDNIKVNENMETNMKGIFACGNITGGLLQICKAVHEGAVAGLQAVQFIREN